MTARIYKLIRKLLPQSARGKLTRLLYSTGLKPTEKSSEKSPLPKAVVIFSADFEMAWAFRHSRSVVNAEKMGLRERENVPVLLETFNRCEIPVTWAIVGHLLLKSCKRNAKGHAHPEMTRPGFFTNRNWSFISGDWYDHDPCSDFLQNPAWYAPDLVDLIMDARVDHEIGCHSFSHIDLTYENCTKELASVEIKKCKELLQSRGIELKSMVFPGGTLGHFEVLKEEGLLCYRDPGGYDIDIPRIDKHGLVSISSSYGLDKSVYNWSTETCRDIAVSYIDRALKSRKICHFWFHPSMDPWYIEHVMPGIIEYIAQQRDKGRLDVFTMGEFARRIKFHIV